MFSITFIGLPKKEILLLNEVQFFLEKACSLIKDEAIYSFQGNRPIKEFTVADWRFLYNQMEIVSKKYKNIPLPTQESLRNLCRYGAGTKNKTIFYIAVFILIKDNKLDEKEFEQLKEFEENKEYFLSKARKEYLQKNEPVVIIPMDLLLNSRPKEGITKGNRAKTMVFSLSAIVTLFFVVFYVFSKFNGISPISTVNTGDTRIKLTYKQANNTLTEYTFNYDISQIPHDSAFIDFGDGKRVVLNVDKEIKYYSFTEDAQHRQVSLLVNQFKKTFFVPICSKGWIAKVRVGGSENEGTRIAQKEIIKKNGVIHVSETPFKTVGEHYVYFQNINNFDFDLDNMIFETRLKNPENEGGISYFDASIDLIGNSEGKIDTLTFAILAPKCTQWGNISVGQTRYVHINPPNDSYKGEK